MQTCDNTCFWCAKSAWEWVKARDAQMSVPRKKKGETTSFAEAARTSNRAPKAFEPCHCAFPVGARVTYRESLFEVAHNAGFVGGDGTHWVGVRGVHGTERFHTPCGMLVTA